MLFIKEKGGVFFLLESCPSFRSPKQSLLPPKCWYSSPDGQNIWFVPSGSRLLLLQRMLWSTMKREAVQLWYSCCSPPWGLELLAMRVGSAGCHAVGKNTPLGSGKTGDQSHSTVGPPFPEALCLKAWRINHKSRHNQELHTDTWIQVSRTHFEEAAIYPSYNSSFLSSVLSFPFFGNQEHATVC